LLGDWVGLSIPLLFGWTGKLIEALHQPHGSEDATQLLVLGEAALSDSAHELAYAVSSAGLALGNANARFLFLRARGLPAWMSIRQKGCLEAALELARRERDTELAGKILDRLGGGRFRQGGLTDSLPPELLNGILEEELQLKKFPSVPRDDQPRYAAQLTSKAAGECDCPKCRGKRGEPLDDWDEDDEDDVFDLEDEEFDDPLEEVPGVLAAIVGSLSPPERQRILKAIEAGDDPLKVLDTIHAAARKAFPGRGGRASGWKPPKPVSGRNDKNRKNSTPDREPVQGSLF
jgi:hypothetical protein